MCERDITVAARCLIVNARNAAKEKYNGTQSYSEAMLSVESIGNGFLEYLKVLVAGGYGINQDFSIGEMPASRIPRLEKGLVRHLNLLHAVVSGTEGEALFERDL